MKTFATIALALVVLGSSALFLLSAICAVSMMPNAGSVIGGAFALISLAVIFGAIVLMAKINKEEAPPSAVTPQKSVTSKESQSGKRS